jgi:hypothetical protein
MAEMLRKRIRMKEEETEKERRQGGRRMEKENGE